MNNLDTLRQIVDEYYASKPHQSRPEQPDETLDIKGLAFHCTCEACPEQYDVFYQGIPVAYVRFRFSDLTVECPHVGGEYVLDETIDNSGFSGRLEDYERESVLNKCAERIVEWMRLAC